MANASPPNAISNTGNDRDEGGEIEMSTLKKGARERRRAKKGKAREDDGSSRNRSAPPPLDAHAFTTEELPPPFLPSAAPRPLYPPQNAPVAQETTRQDIYELFPGGQAQDYDATLYITPAWKKSLYELMEKPTSSDGAFVVHVFTTGLILFSALVTVLETVPFFRKWNGRIWFALETFTVALFTIEYILRCIAHSWDWKALGRWIISFYGIIDLLSVLPYYIILMLKQDTSALFRFSILRMFRLVRVFRPFRYNSSVLMTIEVFYLSVHRSSHALLAIGFFVVMSVTVFSTLLYFAERGTWDDILQTFINSDGDPTQFSSIPAAAWFVMITITTVGYGEITPRSFLGRLLTVPVLILGLLLITLPSFVLGREFSLVWHSMLAKKRRAARQAALLEGSLQAEQLLHDPLRDGPPTAPHPEPDALGPPPAAAPSKYTLTTDPFDTVYPYDPHAYPYTDPYPLATMDLYGHGGYPGAPVGLGLGLGGGPHRAEHIASPPTLSLPPDLAADGGQARPIRTRDGYSLFGHGAPPDTDGAGPYSAPAMADAVREAREWGVVPNRGGARRRRSSSSQGGKRRGVSVGGGRVSGSQISDVVGLRRRGEGDEEEGGVARGRVPFGGLEGQPLFEVPPGYGVGETVGATGIVYPPQRPGLTHAQQQQIANHHARDLTNMKLAQNQTELSRQIQELRGIVEGQVDLIKGLVEALREKDGRGSG